MEDRHRRFQKAEAGLTHAQPTFFSVHQPSVGLQKQPFENTTSHRTWMARLFPHCTTPTYVILIIPTAMESWVDPWPCTDLQQSFAMERMNFWSNLVAWNGLCQTTLSKSHVGLQVQHPQINYAISLIIIQEKLARVEQGAKLMQCPCAHSLVVELPGTSTHALLRSGTLAFANTKGEGADTLQTLCTVCIFKGCIRQWWIVYVQGSRLPEPHTLHMRKNVLSCSGWPSRANHNHFAKGQSTGELGKPSCRFFTTRSAKRIFA